MLFVLVRRDSFSLKQSFLVRIQVLVDSKFWCKNTALLPPARPHARAASYPGPYTRVCMAPYMYGHCCTPIPGPILVRVWRLVCAVSEWRKPAPLPIAPCMCVQHPHTPPWPPSHCCTCVYSTPIPAVAPFPLPLCVCTAPPIPAAAPFPFHCPLCVQCPHTRRGPLPLHASLRLPCAAGARPGTGVVLRGRRRAELGPVLSVLLDSPCWPSPCLSS